MESFFDQERFNSHILPTIYKSIDILSMKLKTVAQRLKKGKRKRKNNLTKESDNYDDLDELKKVTSKIPNIEHDTHTQGETSMNLGKEILFDETDKKDNINNQTESDLSESHVFHGEDNLEEENTDDSSLLMANSISYKQLIIGTLRLISYIYRSPNVAYENSDFIMKNGNIDYLLLKKISVPLINQLFNSYHEFGNKFFFINRRKKVSKDMRTVMSHSTVAMNFLFKLIFEISPCALVSVLFMYIQNDDYAKSCCSILRDYLIPYITKFSRLRHEQLVYEMRLRQMITDKDYMQLFEILKVDIERVIYRKYPLPFNLNNNLKALHILKYHMYKRNTKSIHYYESEEAVQLMSKKGEKSSLIVFVRGMCVFIFDVLECNGENVEDKSWAERLMLYQPFLKERCENIITVTEIHESELDSLIKRPTFIYVKTCGLGLGTFFCTFHKYERKGRRTSTITELPRYNPSITHQNPSVKPTTHFKKNKFAIIDQL
ncbi:GSCOCT00012322001.2-RA-CDS [Cotesia congregata]|uniref:Cc_HzNVorf128 n=1 Tax=Cotesia congregata TaxID=51543 RepID=B9W499_COTCN|nr:GSCOCT00012322001.2-RA-CDS [Cotesia congregata]CAG5093098.1 Cc_HzNVorf128 [Cotesia congregata]CAR31587.1 HzNVORF128-like protein [Cotesia congregata]CAR82251.1 HzNVORF128-like protein [Cotesia congregata]